MPLELTLVEESEYKNQPINVWISFIQYLDTSYLVHATLRKRLSWELLVRNNSSHNTFFNRKCGLIPGFTFYIYFVKGSAMLSQIGTHVGEYSPWRIDYRSSVI